jgi:hypothetical protein
MSAAAWAARSLLAKEAQIRFLEQRIRGYELQLQKSMDKIGDLTAKMAGKLESEVVTNPFLSLRDYMFHDMVRNHGRPKNRRRYSPRRCAWPGLCTRRFQKPGRLFEKVFIFPAAPCSKCIVLATGWFCRRP